MKIISCKIMHLSACIFSLWVMSEASHYDTLSYEAAYRHRLPGKKW